MKAFSTVAAVDLGSNSFRLQVARVEEDQLYPLDSLKDTVRLAAGLSDDKVLNAETRERALASLKRFGERLRGLPRDAVRVVATNTFRVAKNSAEFIREAEAALGFPIEIIAGREEARLIYLGVSHGIPASRDKRLVIDIGGGSTEFIIGTGYRPQLMESLYMGCVSYSRRFFPNGKVTKSAMLHAELAARTEIQLIASGFCAGHWSQAVGSSGSAKALAEILAANGFSDGGITRAGLEKLRAVLVKAGDCNRLPLAGLRPERIPVLPGGFAIMAAAFAELGIEEMIVADTALREGVLYDMLGRFHRHDMRETTVRQFMRRYRADPVQAGRVELLAVELLRQLAETLALDMETAPQMLSWSARLHEIGLTISHAGYHKHSAYILDNADMPGFSKKEQAQLAMLAVAQRGSLNKVIANFAPDIEGLAMILALRLAVQFCRSRAELELPQEMRLLADSGGYQLKLDKAWLAHNSLTHTALDAEAKEWKAIGRRLTVTAG
ncbi:MAG: exopolyphosphatase [Sulfuricella sp.]|nr:exopolyphosphatase [Sulfuricella sp.]